MIGCGAHLSFAIVLSSFAGVAVSAHADDCKLARIADLNVEISHGKIFVPVSIESANRLMAIDTGAPLSALDPQTATNLNLVTRRIYQGAMFNAAGEQFTQMAIIHMLGIGQLRAQDARVLVWPSRMSQDPQMGGVLGADLLRHYDIDIDLANRKVGLFSQDHCPGKVVYWTSDHVAVIPMHVVNSGHIAVPVTLDGHEFDAILDTGSYNTYLSLEAAQNVYGLRPDSPELVRDSNANGPGGVPLYRHTFEALTLEGLKIANVPVVVWHNMLKFGVSQTPPIGSRLSDSDESGGVTDMMLGLHELRNLHVYIAYKEEKIYVSPSVAAPRPPAVLAPPGTNTTDTPTAH